MPAAGTKPDSIPTTDVDTTPQRQRRARLGRRVFMSLMALFVLAGLGTLVGAHTSRISATGSGYSMTLTYSSITRPGLAIRWILVIEHPGGFDKQITVATTSTYFNLFDFNNLDPVPADQTTHGPYSIWIYDPPPGNSLRIIFDGRLEPDQQFGKAATTELRVDGATVASLHYSTRVIP